MAHRGIIQDSDDEDDEFSPVKSRHASPIEPDQQLAHEPDAATSAARSAARSTDPAFFESIYAEQQQHTVPNAAMELSSGDALSSGAVDGSSNRPGSLRDEGKENSSSITDPIVASRRKRVASIKDLESITQVTSPAKNSSSSIDPYAIPSSPLEAPGDGTRSKNTKTYSKRKRNQQLSPAKSFLQGTENSYVPGTDQQHDSSPGLSKRRRISGGRLGVSPGAEDVDLVLVPRTDYANVAAKSELQAKDTSSSIVYDTMKTVSETPVDLSAASFYVARRQLSASQKRQYQPVNCSSDYGSERHSDSKFGQAANFQAEQRSSDDATIAYTTPSRFGSSNAPRPSAVQQSEELPSPKSGALSTKERMVPDIGYEPASSPDVLTGASPAIARAKLEQGSDIRQALTQDVSLLSGARKRKQKQQSPAEDVSGAADDAELPQERYVPRPSKRRAAAGAMPDTQLPDATDATAQVAGPEDNEPFLISSGQASIEHAVPELPPLKKRGRKKKATQPSGAAESHQQGLNFDGHIAEIATPETNTSVKRKRGRPRKAETPAGNPGADNSRARSRESAELTGEALAAVDDTFYQPDIEDRADQSDGQEEGPQTQAIQKGRRKTKLAEAEILKNSKPTGSQEKEVLKDISNVAATPHRTPSTVEDGSNRDGVTPDGKDVEEHAQSKKEASLSVSKSVFGNSQPSKAVYRVGLSKRSRIAPLLKSLRK